MQLTNIQIALILLLFASIISIIILKKRKNQHGSSNNTKSNSVEKESVLEIPTQQSKKDKSQNKAKDNQRQRSKDQSTAQTKSLKQIQQCYKEYYYGSVSLRGNKDLFTITSLTAKNSKILMGNTKNQLVLFDLKKLKKEGGGAERYFTTLQNNTASAVAISPKYYFAALNFDKTIVYFEFLAGQGGIYFKQIRRFSRNIYKSEQVAMFVPQNEKFIITAGHQADTTVSVWTMNGQSLHTFSTYQIEQYESIYGGSQILVRGWTSQIKAFKFITNKDGSFAKIEKGKHLTHSQKPKSAAIDILGNLVLTISGNGQCLKLWTVSDDSRSQQLTRDSYKLGLSQVEHAIVVTTRGQNERLKTILVVSDKKDIVICNRHIEQVKRFEGIGVQGLVSFGSVRSAALGIKNGGKMIIWNVTSLIQSQVEYLPHDL